MWRVRVDCRVCGGEFGPPVVDLGAQAYGTEFPLPHDPDPAVEPLVLVRCVSCGLLQLAGSVDPAELYTNGYGYRSGVNATMRCHLSGVVGAAADRVTLQPGDVVLDIASNDGTLLSNWKNVEDSLTLIGIDPIASGPEDARLLREFFSAHAYLRTVSTPAKVITSIACLYDVDDPSAFCHDVASILADDGIWVIEVMGAADMLKGAWDMLHHEHVCYFSIEDLHRLTAAAGLRILGSEHFSINGGTIRVYVGHGRAEGSPPAAAADVDDFSDIVQAAIADIRSEIAGRLESGQRLYTLGASQKGNTILQACGFSTKEFIGASERNPTKFGRVTPISRIPIVAEEEARAHADAMLVLPWHFRDEILVREQDFLASGGELIFPLPELSVVSGA